MATLVDRFTWFVLGTAWCIACSDGFSSSSRDKGSPTTPGDGAGMGSDDADGSSATGGVGGGRAPSTGKLGGGMGLPSGGTSRGGSGTATGGTGSSNQGGSENGGSTSSGATGGAAGDVSAAGTGGSAPQAGSGSGATPAQGGASGPAGGTGGSSMTAGAPNDNTGGSEPLGGCDHQLLANADFEAGPSPSWSEESTWPGIEIVVAKDNPDLLAEGVAPYGGNYLGWLGGIPDNEWDHELVILRQGITLPATAATLTLSGRRYVKSLDDPSEPFDVAYLEFETEEEELAWQAQAWTNQDTTSGWVPFTATTDVEPQYRGKRLTFVAYSNTDPEGQTSFFIDDLRLVAGCGR